MFQIDKLELKEKLRVANSLKASGAVWTATNAFLSGKQNASAPKRSKSLWKAATKVDGSTQQMAEKRLGFRNRIKSHLAGMKNTSNGKQNESYKPEQEMYEHDHHTEQQDGQASYGGEDMEYSDQEDNRAVPAKPGQLHRLASFG